MTSKYQTPIRNTKPPGRASASVGTLAWARETRGLISRRDQFAQLAQAALLQLRVLPAQLMQAMRLDRAGPARLAPEDLVPPDSAFARKAEALCAEISSTPLYNHCLRTYFWGKVFASRDSIRFDDELLYAASLFHDHGLTPRYANAWDGAQCFALDGAEAARQFAEAEAWDAQRQEAVAEAITLHLNVRVGIEHGAEAHLLSVGAAVDVTGLRVWDIPRGDIGLVIERYPRDGFKREVADKWTEQCTIRPGCRADFLERYLGFTKRIRRASFDTGA